MSNPDRPQQSQKCKVSQKKPCRMWQPENLPENFAILLCSARRAGKTTLLKSLSIKEPGAWLSRFEDGFISVFCGNEHCASEYKSFIPGKYVHNSLRLDIIQNYWEWCDTTREAGKPIPQCLMIFDDILVTQSNKKYGVTRTSNNYWLNRIWAEGRHQNISSVLSVQSLAVGLPFVRCSDVFICFPSAFYAGQDWKMLTENYMPVQCRKTASQIADCFTQFECMICEYFRQTSRRWQTRIFWYKVGNKIAKYDPDVESAKATGKRSENQGGPSSGKEDWAAAFTDPDTGTGGERAGVSSGPERDAGGNQRSGHPLETC